MDLNNEILNDKSFNQINLSDELTNQKNSDNTSDKITDSISTYIKSLNEKRLDHTISNDYLFRENSNN